MELDGLKEFAEAVKERAAEASEAFRFGRYKVFIAWLEPSKTTKRLLLEAQAAGLVRLTRADLVPAMDAEMVKKSEVVKDLGFIKPTFHFVDLETAS